MSERYGPDRQNNSYFELRKWCINGQRGGRDSDYYLLGRYDTAAQAYLAAFAEISKQDAYSEYFDPVLDITEVRPQDLNTYQVSLATINGLHKQNEEKLIEVEMVQ